MFLPLRVARIEGGDDVRFRTGDGFELVGTYLKARTPRRSGVMVFCHEYLSDRWGALPYVDHLRDLGFDLFSFDFRNHGESQVDPAYHPLQWVTDRELTDLEAALAYLRTRTDADPAGVGLFGVSRGGGTALCVAGRDPKVWGVVTDGAFPTRGTMLPYILRWGRALRRHRPALEGGPDRRLRLPRLGRPAPGPGQARLPLRERRAGGGQALATPLALDPRRPGQLHRRGHRQGLVRAGGRTQGIVDRRRGQAQSMPGKRPGRLSRAGLGLPPTVRTEGSPRGRGSGGGPLAAVVGSPPRVAGPGQSRRARLGLMLPASLAIGAAIGPPLNRTVGDLRCS